MAKTITDYQKDYAAAKSRGDSAAMQAANNGANAIRASTGQAAVYAGQDIANVAARSGGNKPNATTLRYSGGDPGFTNLPYTGGTPEVTSLSFNTPGGNTDYSAVIYDPSASHQQKLDAYYLRYEKEKQMRAAGTWNNNWIPTEQLLDKVNNTIQPQTQTTFADSASQFEQRQEDNNALAQKYYEQLVQQGIDRLNAQRGGINSSYDDAARQAYISYQQQQKATPQQMAALGMTGGATESSLIQQQSAYQGNLSGLESARNKALNDISTAVTDLQNSGDLQTAQYILSNADKISEVYLNALNADISRRDNLSQQATQNAQYSDSVAYSQKQDAYSKALQIAQATGNFSVMKQYGWTDEQIRAANQQLLPSSGSGSSSGGSRSQDNGSSAYLPSVDYSEEQPTAGLTVDQLLSAGTGIAAGSILGNIMNGITPTNQTSLGTKYSTVWNNARRMFDSGKTADEIAKYLDMFDEAQLSDSGMEKILKSLNLYGVRGS